MDSIYLDILQEWERKVADPAVYENLDSLFPEYAFRRLHEGSPKDHWASRYKLDLTLPRYRNAEKTVVYRSDMRFREQGDWDRSVSIIDKYMSDKGLTSIYDAYKHVSSLLGLAMPQPGDRAVAEAIGKKARQASLLETLVDYFCWNLRQNRSAKASATRTYLRKARGFTDEQIERLCFGFVPDWNKVVRYISVERHFPVEDLNEVCGVTDSQKRTAVGKTHVLAIPYECAGVLKGFLFRRIDDGREGPKYLANAGLDRKSVFFNITADPDPKDIIVVEGEMDALTATAAGMENIVAIGGSEIAGERRMQVDDALNRRGVEKITLCLDLDPCRDGAADFSSRHAHIMKSVHTIKDVEPSFEEIYVADFRTPADPAEFIMANGIEAFRALLDNAKPYWEYLYRYKANTINYAR